QGRCVHGDVGSSLVDDADHAQGHADLTQVQAVGQDPTAYGFTHRVGQFHDLTYCVGDLLDAFRGQPQPVDHRRGGTCFLCPFHILCVGCCELVGLLGPCVGDRRQCGALHPPTERGEVGRCVSGTLGNSVHLALDVTHLMCGAGPPPSGRGRSPCLL